MTLWELMGQYDADYVCPEIIGKLPIKIGDDFCRLALSNYFNSREKVENDIWNCWSNVKMISIKDVQPYLFFEKENNGLTLKMTFGF